MITERLEATIERLYAERRARFVETFWFVALGFLWLVVVLALLVYLRYIDATPAQAARIVAFHALLVPVAGRLVLVPQWRRVSAPVIRWLRGEADGAETVEAWQSARSLSVTMALKSMKWGAISLVLPSLVYFRAEFDIPPAGMALAAYAGVSTGLWACAFGVPASDLWFRPVARDLSHAIGSPGMDLHVAGMPMGRKLLVAVPLISVLSGVTVAVAATAVTGSVPDIVPLIGVALAVTFSTSGAMVLLTTRALVAPMEDLLAATRRVGAGELSARAEVTTDDEIGALSLRVNSMLDRLEETTAANRQLLDEIRASRLRIVAASDAERQRVERAIHDGPQQRLVSLALRFGMLREHDELDDQARQRVDECVAELSLAMADMRNLAQGLHPAVLTTHGLRAALQQLAVGAALPVTVSADDERYDPTVESTAWFIASEAMANVAKYAQASSIEIDLASEDGHLVLEISDDGIGGAQSRPGSGLAGLADRVAAVGGVLDVQSRPRVGTTVRAELPVGGVLS